MYEFECLTTDVESIAEVKTLQNVLEGCDPMLGACNPDM